MRKISVSEHVLLDVLQRKSIDATPKTLEQLKNAYNKTLSEYYCAVMIDIDGTLVGNNDASPTEDIREIIAQLTRQRVLIWFVTGRGRGSARSILFQLAQAILHHQASSPVQVLNWSSFSNWCCFTHGGAYFLSSPSFDESTFLANELCLINDKDRTKFSKTIADNFADINNYLKESCNNNIDKITQEPASIRIITKFCGNDIQSHKCKALFYSLKTYLDGIVGKSRNFVKGIYENQVVFEYGLADKEKSITERLNITGIPQNHVVRIGDNGGFNEIDHSFLDCEQGFSVGSISNTLNHCLPVFNFLESEESQELLSGSSATRYLLENLIFYPALCVKKADKSEYIDRLSKIEREAQRGTQKNHVVLRNTT